jgi:hypothetical protein
MTAPSSIAPPRAGVVRRFLAASAGAIVLIVSATFTLGTVLAAPLGVLVARAIARRRGARLSLAAAWAGAVLGCFVAVPIAFGALLAAAPPGTVATIRSAMDSAKVEQKPAELPEWLQRVTPPGTQRQSAATEKLFNQGPFVVFFGVMGALMACSVFATIAGSVGWVSSLLLGYAITGRAIVRNEARPAAPDSMLE